MLGFPYVFCFPICLNNNYITFKIRYNANPALRIVILFYLGNNYKQINNLDKFRTDTTYFKTFHLVIIKPIDTEGQLWRWMMTQCLSSCSSFCSKIPWQKQLREKRGLFQLIVQEKPEAVGHTACTITIWKQKMMSIHACLLSPFSFFLF